MSKFARYFDSNLIMKLQTEELYEDRILNDIENGEIFPAIRRGYMCFYHKGGRPFKYNEKGEFETHRKYFSLLDTSDKYITPKDLKNPSLNDDFIQAYEDIKERSQEYSDDEAEGISVIYENYPYTNFSNLDTNSVLLDIEVGLVSEKSEEKEEREIKKKVSLIDLLLYNVENRSLKFVEVKEFTNNSLRSQDKPDVVEQLKRYNNIVSRKESEIISAYGNYIELINKLFDLQLPKPKEVKDECGLFIFGFNRDVKKGKLEKIIKNLRTYGVNPYSIGYMRNLKIDTLWKEV